MSRERTLGDTLTFYPYSSTLGAVMVPAQSPIRALGDLRGKRLAVAGGPLDKSWLMLRALARRSGLDLAKEARPVYGAPPLMAAKLAQGEIDAALQFWNFCADLEAHGVHSARAEWGQRERCGDGDGAGDADAAQQRLHNRYAGADAGHRV